MPDKDGVVSNFIQYCQHLGDPQQCLPPAKVRPLLIVDPFLGREDDPRVQFPLTVGYEPGLRHCSTVNVHYFYPATKAASSGTDPADPNTGLVAPSAFPTRVDTSFTLTPRPSSKPAELSVSAVGQEGGCDKGTLVSWGGNFYFPKCVYRAPDASLQALGTIAQRAQNCTEMALITPSELGTGAAIGLTASEAPGVYLDGRLTLDTDGAPPEDQKGDPDAERDTALTIGKGNKGAGDPLNASIVPYVAMTQSFAQAHGMALGDIVAVVCAGKVDYAIYGDNKGAEDESAAGEGSTALHLGLGHDVWKRDKAGKRTGGVIGPRQASIDWGVVTLMFPGSGKEKFDRKALSTLDPKNQAGLAESIRQEGERLFSASGGNPNAQGGGWTPKGQCRENPSKKG